MPPRRRSMLGRCRTAFGGSPEELRTAVERGPQQVVADLFAEAEGAGPGGQISLLLGAGDIGLLQAWWLRGICSGPGGLGERATLMWHNHFATSWNKVADVRLMHSQNVSLRQHGLGPFRALLHAMLVDPAMLVWLDGTENRAGELNENLARELFELFSLGRGNYSEVDVRETARALSGWSVVSRRGRLVERYRDSGAKQILGTSGDLQVAEVVDIVLEQPACARFIAGRLIHEYIGPRADGALLDEVARDLRAGDFDLGATIGRLLVSRALFAPDVRAGRIGSPIETMAIASRGLGVSLAPKRAAALASRLGQAPFQPPTVAGWEGDRAWIGSTRWVGRRELARELAGAWAETAAGSDPTTIVDELLGRLLPGRPVPDWRQSVIQAAADAANTNMANRTAAALILTSPEFQLV